MALKRKEETRAETQRCRGKQIRRKSKTPEGKLAKGTRKGFFEKSRHRLAADSERVGVEGCRGVGAQSAGSHGGDDG
jgi:hypothetical protein